MTNLHPASDESNTYQLRVAVAVAALELEAFELAAACWRNPRAMEIARDMDTKGWDAVHAVDVKVRHLSAAFDLWAATHPRLVKLYKAIARWADSEAGAK